MKRIDSHQHFWKLDRGDYRWLTPELTSLYRDFLPRDLEPRLATAGIERTMLVQAADSVDESRYMLTLAAEHDFITGVVGWIDFESGRAARDLEELGESGLLRGVRPMIQDIADPDWMLRRDLAPAFDAVESRDLVFDALVKPRHLENLAALVGSRPSLRVVIDHGAKPSIGRGRWSDEGFEAWATSMRTLAAMPNTWCKLSGLATEAHVDWTAKTLRPYCDTLLDAFGPDRLLWGSDWPVVNLAGGYGRWWDATEELLDGLSESERDAILGGTAGEVYGVES